MNNETVSLFILLVHVQPNDLLRRKASPGLELPLAAYSVGHSLESRSWAHHPMAFRGRSEAAKGVNLVRRSIIAFTSRGVGRATPASGNAWQLPLPLL
jgi:hypothetical protein